MKLSYIASQTLGLPGTEGFKSWGRVVNSLQAAHYNSYEIEVIAKTPGILRAATKPFGGKAPFTSLVKYLAANDMAHGSKRLTGLIFKMFGKKDKLEYNEDGKLCHRGTMPGNPQGGSILVPIGTPLSCDPTSETYWSM